MSNYDLCEAARAGDVSRVKELIANGANPDGDWDPEKGMKRQQEYMQLLQGSGDEMNAQPHGATAKEHLGYLLEAPESEEIPLFCAATGNSIDCVRALIVAGADVDKRDNSSQTVLYFASSVEMIRFLMGKGLSLDDRDRFGKSPLESAVSGGKKFLSRIEALVEAGADVNATDDDGDTVFMVAVQSICRDPEVLEYLVEAGADPHCVSKFGSNAFHNAVDYWYECYEERCVCGILTYLKQLGIDLEHRNDFDRTPLADAIDSGTGTEVRVLCELGADPNAYCPRYVGEGDECHEVSSPLVYAALQANIHPEEKLRALLSFGAETVLVDAEGLSLKKHAIQELESLECSEPDDDTMELIIQIKRCVELLRNAEAPPL